MQFTKLQFAPASTASPRRIPLRVAGTTAIKSGSVRVSPKPLVDGRKPQTPRCLGFRAAFYLGVRYPERPM